MEENFNKKLLLEHCFLPSKIDGYKIGLDNVEIPLVGIKGLGEEYERNGKRSVWVCGEILSPNFIGNDNCACRSHIEGIVKDEGKMRILESVYNFHFYEGSCFEYNLIVKDKLSNLVEFDGDVLSRLSRDDFKPIKTGQINLILNPNWEKSGSGESRIHSLPYWNRKVYVNETSIPKFWNTFLGEIEEDGYEHPYMAVTEKLKKEREEKKMEKTDKLNSNKDDLPF